MNNEPKMSLYWAVATLLIFGLLAVGYFYFLKPKTKLPETGTVNIVENVSKDVPKIITNPAEKVPETNPLDRVNPFKYNNPLR